MITAACVLLGLIQAFLWWHSKNSPTYPLSMIMAFSAAVVAILEINISLSPELSQHRRLLVWQNLAVAMVLVPMVWSIQTYLPTARRWMAILITLLWVIGVAINFLLPGNLTFSEILAVKRHLTFWGEEYFIPVGRINDWKWLVDITVLLIPIYAIDAAWRARTLRSARHGWVIAGGVVLFVLIAGTQAILVDSGSYHAPHVISPAFLFVVIALTWVLARDAVLAGRLAEKFELAQRESERLMHAKLLGEVAGALAHELNQPLAAILGNVQAAAKFLDHPDPDIDEIREILADIERDDKRARDIIANLRNMLRGDQPEGQSVKLEAATRQTIDFLGAELGRHDISVKFTSEGDLPEVCGGQVAIQQVIINLLLNAVHAIRDANALRRVIWIRLMEQNGGAEVVVRDFGPGIDQEIRPRMFDPFVTTKKGNLGMGLAVCRRIIENHGGQLTAENAEGGGARFRFWLPACSP